MSVTEIHGERTVDNSATGVTARRVYLTTWADRYTTSGTSPDIMPVFNQAHPDFDKCKVQKKVVEEYGGTDGAGPTHARVIIEYTTKTFGVISITANTISFADTDPDTILDSGSGFLDAGFVKGVITVTNSVSNDGNWTIDDGGVAAGALTLVIGDALTPEGAGALITITQENKQITKTIELSAQILSREADGIMEFPAKGNAGMTTIAFNDNGALPDTITDSAGNFLKNGLHKGTITVLTGSTTNDGTYTIVTVTAGTITLAAENELTTEAAGTSVSIDQEDIIKKPISVFVPQGVMVISKILDTFPFATINKLISKINHTAFYGEDTGTFMFLGCSAREEKNTEADNIWYLDYRFQYNQNGWNYFWNPDARKYEIVQVGDIMTYTNNTIAFDDNVPAADTITDSASNFLNYGFHVGEITVSGSVLNNATYNVVNVTAGTLTLASDDGLLPEVAGATVTISQINRIYNQSDFSALDVG